MMGDFHFLRPWWLAALVPVLLTAWAIRRASDAQAPWRGLVAPYLLPYLVQGAKAQGRNGPWWLLLALWSTAVFVLAGPSWKREPSPFADDTAALAIVIRVAPSMTTEDLPPNRLARSVQKVHDLLALRGDAKTALVAYAGTAHLVMPPTADAEIIDTFAAALDPEIMPAEGDAAAAALRLADRTLAEAGGGSILWIADDVSGDQLTAIADWRKTSRTPVRLFAPLVETSALDDAADAADAKVIRLRPDDADVAELARAAKFASPAPGADGGRWKDGGYALIPLLLVLLLPFFRRGWMPPIAARS